MLLDHLSLLVFNTSKLIEMRYFRTFGNHIIVVRLPVFTDVILVFWVSEINELELSKAALQAMQVLSAKLRRSSYQTKM